MALTIVDVARLAGVSTSTVSHVLNGTRPVNEATRERVVGAIKATSYTRDAQARALRRSRTDSIGLVISDSGQPVFADMVRGVEDACQEADFTLLLTNSSEDPDRELKAIEALQARRVDGLIIARTAHSRQVAIDWPRAQNVPVVLLDRLVDLPIDQVGVENEGPMRALVDHLLELGHRRIGIAAGNLAVPTMRERYAGYETSLAGVGIEVEPTYVVTGTGAIEDTRERVRQLLSKPDRPTAFVSASSPMTIGTLRAAVDLGVRVPADVAFATFDSLPCPDLIAPALTTVDQPAREVGREAMRLLLRRFKSPKAKPRTVRLTPTITHRWSCGCSPGSSPLVA